MAYLGVHSIKCLDYSVSPIKVEALAIWKGTEQVYYLNFPQHTMRIVMLSHCCPCFPFALVLSTGQAQKSQNKYNNPFS